MQLCTQVPGWPRKFPADCVTAEFVGPTQATHAMVLPATAPPAVVQLLFCGEPKKPGTHEKAYVQPATRELGMTLKAALGTEGMGQKRHEYSPAVE